MNQAVRPLVAVFVCLTAWIPASCGQPASSGSSGPPASSPPAVEPVISVGVPAAIISASSTLEKFDPSGLLRAAEPGWHAEKSPSYPQWLQVDFGDARTISRISLLPQDTLAARAPKQMEIQASMGDGKWTPVTSIADACSGGENHWRVFQLDKPVAARQLKLVIHSNCGDPSLLTLRGLKVE